MQEQKLKEQGKGTNEEERRSKVYTGDRERKRGKRQKKYKIRFAICEIVGDSSYGNKI